MYCRNRNRNRVSFLLFFKLVLKRVNNNMLISVYIYMVGYYIMHRWVNMLFSYKCK
jgi:hypothetical protein